MPYAERLDPQLATTLRDLNARLNMVVSRCAVRLTDPRLTPQRLQIVGPLGAVWSNVEHLEPYGLTAHPPRGAPGIVMCPQGEPDLALSPLVSHPASRPRGLPPGGVMLWTRANGPRPGRLGAHGLPLLPEPRAVHARGRSILLKADREIRIQAAGLRITVTPDTIRIQSADLITVGERLPGQFEKLFSVFLPEISPFSNAPTREGDNKYGNNSLLERLSKDPDFKKKMIRRYPGFEEWIKKPNKNISPPGTTWHHDATNEHKLHLVDREDHRKNPKIYNDANGRGGFIKRWGRWVEIRRFTPNVPDRPLRPK